MSNIDYLQDRRPSSRPLSHPCPSCLHARVPVSRLDIILSFVWSLEDGPLFSLPDLAFRILFVFRSSDYRLVMGRFDGTCVPVCRVHCPGVISYSPSNNYSVLPRKIGSDFPAQFAVKYKN